MRELVVLGAGASGLMAAARLRRRDILILEHNPKPAAKIAISGGGRCNITNERVSRDDYLGDAAFVEKVLHRFDNRALLTFLRRYGLEPVVRKKGQYFCPRQATELIDLLRKLADHAELATNVEVLGAERSDAGFHVRTSEGIVHAKRLLVASGGLSYASLGASGIGYEIAERFGHAIMPTRPALVGLTLQKEQAWMKELAGVSLPVAITVGRRRIEGDLLFAHKGISGPAVLDASLFWHRGKITIDFLPGLKLKTVLKHPQRSVLSQLPLPKRFAQAFFEAMAIPPVPYARMQEHTKQRLSQLKSYALAPAGTFGFARAEVTKGGVATDAIDPATMQSRLVEGLYFAGEVMDVTGRLGGYNFQWAFSSAVVAAEAIEKSL